MQGAHKDLLGRLRRRAVALPGATESSGLSQAQPIGCLVEGPAKALRVNEGFDEQQGMAEACQPIAGQPPLAQRQDARAEIRPVAIPQDKETTVAGEELQAVILMAKVPADPLASHRTFPGCGR